MIRWKNIFIGHFFKWAALSLLLSLSLYSFSHGQQSSSATEVPLTFQYRGVVNVYVTSYYKDDQFYLPVSELLSILEIQHQIDQGAFTISGTYLGETEYKFDFKNQIVQAGETKIELQVEDFLIPEIDYYIKPSIFEKLFDLEFTTNFNNLTLDLETEDKMPVVARYEREQKRKQLDREQPHYRRSYHPLRYDRDYGTLDGAFLDYNLSTIHTSGSSLFTFSNALGIELLGGDIQGNIFGAYSRQQQSLTTSGLRWRYVQRNNDYFTNGIIGQTNSEGFANRSIRGIKVSNKPIEPRQLFDRYVIDGSTTPLSEVELYLNNRLVDFQEADESGNYRFVVPLTYGSTNYSLRIYTPSGRAIERSNRIQIPFDYLPKGEVDYTVSAGELTTPILGTTEGGYMGAASVSAGLSDWLTARLSTEYLAKYHGSMPSVTGTLNARLFSNYLLSANINSDNFYRLTSSVVYSSGASWSLSYDYNPDNIRLYSTGSSEHRASVNIFTPFNIGSVPLNIRWSSTYQQNQLSDLLRYRADISSRFGRLNVRLGYRDQQAGPVSFIASPGSRLTNSYTYSLGRRSSIPGVFRGMFIRGQVNYLPGLDQFEEMEFQLSRDIQRTGRIQLSYGRNFLGDFNTFGLNITIDFDKIRSNTSSTSNGSQFSFTQNVRGSIGYDPYWDQVLFHNRQQVGQSGAAVRMFVDMNNDGSYQQETDEIINDSAVRLNRSGGRTTIKNGVSYISQLLPYYRYDIEINKGALSNPLLVPDVEQFSIITDPNQYKPIEVPFYQSGVISGKVERLQVQGQDTTISGLSGVRLYLESAEEDTVGKDPHSETVRTFSDGSFYTYEVPPGKYNLYIDPSQLEFLDAVSRPDTMHIEVESLAEGDFIQDLSFRVIPRQPQKDTADTDQKKDVTQKVREDTQRYQIQIVSYSLLENAKDAAMGAEEKFGSPFNILYNHYTGLFAVRSRPVVGLDQAVDLLIKIRDNSNFNNPALVVLHDDDTQFTVQLAKFTSAQQAQQFIDESENKLDLELTYHLDQKDNLFKVWTEPVKTQKAIKKLLTKLKDLPRFIDAFIPKYAELIFDSRNFVYEIYLRDITDSSELDLPSAISPQQIKQDSLKNKIWITDITSWLTATDWQSELSTLNPETNPIIIINDPANNTSGGE